jgi:hypothetical protein
MTFLTQLRFPRTSSSDCVCGLAEALAGLGADPGGFAVFFGFWAAVLTGDATSAEAGAASGGGTACAVAGDASGGVVAGVAVDGVAAGVVAMTPGLVAMYPPDRHHLT